MMSSRIRSGLCCSTFSSASTPSFAVMIFTGSASRNAWSNSTFCTLSSTIMTVDWGRKDSELAGGWPGACDIDLTVSPNAKEGKVVVQALACPSPAQAKACTTICTLTIVHGSCLDRPSRSAEGPARPYLGDHHEPFARHFFVYRLRCTGL